MVEDDEKRFLVTVIKVSPSFALTDHGDSKLAVV